MIETLEIEMLKMDEMELKESARYVKKEETAFKVVPLEVTVEGKSRRTVVYCTQMVVTCKIEIISGEEIERFLGFIFHEAIFVNRRKKFTAVEV